MSMNYPFPLVILTWVYLLLPSLILNELCTSALIRKLRSHMSEPGRIKKRAAHSENFLGGMVCTGNLAFRLQKKYNCFKLDDSGNCIIRKTWLHCI